MMHSALAKSRSADNMMDLEATGLPTRRSSGSIYTETASTNTQRSGSGLLYPGYDGSNIATNGHRKPTGVSILGGDLAGSLSPSALERIRSNRREGICVDDWDWRRYLMDNAMTRANNAYASTYNPSIRSPVPCPISEPLDDSFVSNLAKIVLVD